MNNELLAAMLLPAAVSAGIVFLAFRGTATLRRLVGSSSSRGHVRALGDPLSTRVGRRCVWLRRRFRHTTREVFRSGGKTTTTSTLEWLDDAEVFAAEACLVAAPGRDGARTLPEPVSLELREAQVVEAPRAVTTFTREELEREFPAVAERLLANSVEIELVEEYVEVDSFVNLYGAAVAKAAASAYREAALSGPLVVLVGGRAGLVARSLVTLSLVLGIALGLAWVAWTAWYEMKLTATLGW